MKKIETSEVKRILEMHSKLKKKPILEQNVPDADNDVSPTVSGVNSISNSTPKVELPKINQDEVDLKLLRDAQKTGCLFNGKFQYLKGTKKPVYVVTTTIETLDPVTSEELIKVRVVVFYPDMTYKFTEKDKNGKTLSSKSGKWKCSSLETLANAEKQKASQKATVDTDVARELEQYGWKERKDIAVTDTELSQLYQKHPKYDLFKLKVNTAKEGGYTTEQQAFITNWEDKGYKSKLSPEDLATGTFQKVKVEGSEQYFPGGLIMYKPAAGEQDKKACRDKVKQYYDYWKTKRENIPQSQFDSLKSQVQACANQFDGKWGGVFSIVDNYIKTLRGGTGGPLTYGEDSKWRLK